MKSRRAILLGIAVTVVVVCCCVAARRIRQKPSLEFVGNGRLGATQVAIFRLRADAGCVAELVNEGEILEENGAEYDARWFTNCPMPFAIGGEHQFAVIIPHKGSWRLKLVIHSPRQKRDRCRLS